ncbi:velvet factor-domain-containing protein [Crucibulum laeve]|uniref:Velvet factor-domain-containing protein n=1 Tax=Crucibulum laeve TaxID=68775 RepID=A0A5C3MHI0_9AGAR|nr:velvet factor-domain-containing protein [Crucibulum laeve]
MNMPFSLDHRQTTGADDGFLPQTHAIGQPMYFVSGQFAGHTIRGELQELQKAESGRKYARVDRRPLDPPPAVLLRLFYVRQVGTTVQEREVSYEEIINVGIMCTVDLFPVPDALLDGDTHARPHSTVRAEGPPYTFFPLHPYTTPNVNGTPSLVSPFQIPRRQPMLDTLRPHATPPHDTVMRMGNHLITESSKLTPALVGEKFVEPTLVDYKGRKALIFVFGDLAVQREGTFIFRYRAFDLFSLASGAQHHPVLTELYGGAFRVYSTREFPGLAPSTSLTRSLSKYGVRVTLRDAERKSKKRGNRRASTTSCTSHGSSDPTSY